MFALLLYYWSSITIFKRTVVWKIMFCEYLCSLMYNFLSESRLEGWLSLPVRNNTKKFGWVKKVRKPHLWSCFICNLKFFVQPEVRTAICVLQMLEYSAVSIPSSVTQMEFSRVWNQMPLTDYLGEKTDNYLSALCSLHSFTALQ